MLGSERRVAITGLGLVTPLGHTPDSIWASVAECRGAVRPLEAFRIAGLPNDAGAEIRDFDLKKYSLPKYWNALRKTKKYLARDIQLAVAAAQLAVVDAGLDEGGVDPTRIGIDLGAGLISSELDELAPAIGQAYGAGKSFDFQVWGRESIEMIEPIWLLKYLPNMLACHISILIDCQGPSNTITEADASSNLAEAARIISRGRADVMITGGADSKIHPLSLVRMSLFETISRWKGDPSQACRPFDRRRDGWVPGEGAGIVILEEWSHAQERGARILGEVLGGGSGCDAMPGGGLDPEGCGTEVAITAALEESGLAPEAVGHVNAHGSAGRVSDLAEARALERIFGQGGVPVTALKGYMGNLASGCGAVDMMVSLIGVNRGKVPPILNCDELDPEMELDVVQSSPRLTDNPIFVTTNLTPNGQAAALVIRGCSSEA
jgi:3-oxoacyl-[acyl-carrier-protein] synthase II